MTRIRIGVRLDPNTSEHDVSHDRRMTFRSSWRPPDLGAIYPRRGNAGLEAPGVATGVALAGVLIGFYISGYLVGNTPSFRPQASGAAANPTGRTSRSRPSPPSGRRLPRTPTGSRTSSGTAKAAGSARTVWTLPAQRDRARHDLQLRRRERPAQPVLRTAAGTRRHGDRRREAARGDDARRTVAHVRGPRARRARRSSRRSPTTQRTSATTRRARCRWRTARSRSRSGPGSRATIAGSASSPARPGSSTASAARCRRSATWTAS